MWVGLFPPSLARRVTDPTLPQWQWQKKLPLHPNGLRFSVFTLGLRRWPLRTLGLDCTALVPHLLCPPSSLLCRVAIPLSRGEFFLPSFGYVWFQKLSNVLL